MSLVVYSVLIPSTLITPVADVLSSLTEYALAALTISTAANKNDNNLFMLSTL